jgi:hypothetical protein
MFILVTLSTMMILVVGLWLDVFSPLRTQSASFLVMYGTANFYVWLLIFAYLPDYRQTMDDVIDIQSSSTLPEPDTTGVLGDLEDDVAMQVNEVSNAKTAPPPRRAAALAQPRVMDESVDSEDVKEEIVEVPNAIMEIDENLDELEEVQQKNIASKPVPPPVPARKGVQFSASTKSA